MTRMKTNPPIWTAKACYHQKIIRKKRGQIRQKYGNPFYISSSDQLL